MAVFVLTGDGIDGAGVHCRRHDIIDVLTNEGHEVAKSVTARVDFLVASTTDTKKVADAAKKGVPTISYQQMWNIVLHGIFPAGVTQNIVATPPPPLEQASVAEQLKDNPLFGSF